MRIPRVYLNTPLTVGENVTLSEDAHRHVVNVLRLKIGNELILFNGCGNEFQSIIVSIEKKITTVEVLNEKIDFSTAALKIDLGISLIKNDKFDFAVQKAVELGVSSITPLTATRSTIKLDQKRSTKRLAHWQGIIESACEQSGQNKLPTINSVSSIKQWLQSSNTAGIIFEPTSSMTLSSLTIDKEIRIIIGPEGGFTENELEVVGQHNFSKIKLGPRVLRAETAAIAAITSLQLLWGDLKI